MSDEQIIKNYVRSQWRLEGDLTVPQWLTSNQRKWWLEEANKIEQERGKKK